MIMLTLFHFARAALFARYTQVKSSNLLALAILNHLSMSNDEIRIKLADATLQTQIDLASKVASTINTRVYLYDSSSFFSTPPFDTVLYDNVRTIRKNGKTALLSIAAQKIVPTADTYRSLVPPFRIGSDSTGVYVNP
jgi:hypothetical protein